MKNLVIIGAGSYGREIYNLALECKGYGTDYVIKGYIDNLYEEVGYANYPPILGKVDEYTPQEDDVFTCALMDVNIKKKYVDLIIAKGGEFINLIHRSALIWQNTLLGKGCILCDNIHISCDIKIGDFVTVQPMAVLGHDVTIGDYCHLNCYCFLGGKVNVGNMVTINTSAVIIPGLEIGDNSVVGAGAVVMRKVKPGCTVIGNPAKVLNF